MARKAFATYHDFWPHYLAAHSRPLTRHLHIAGSLAGLALALTGVVLGQFLWVLGAIVLGYGIAWASHVLVEGNRPATFGHPVWSLLSDLRMTGLFLTGRLEGELRRHKISLS